MYFSCHVRHAALTLYNELVKGNRVVCLINLYNKYTYTCLVHELCYCKKERVIVIKEVGSFSYQEHLDTRTCESYRKTMFLIVTVVMTHAFMYYHRILCLITDQSRELYPLRSSVGWMGLCGLKHDDKNIVVVVLLLHSESKPFVS